MMTVSISGRSGAFFAHPRAALRLGLLCAVVLAAPLSGQAQQADIFRMSAGDLLKAFRGEAAAEIADGEVRRQVSFATASSYVAGVADATDGVAWCMEGGMLLHELTDRVFTELKKASPDTLAQNAAIPVLAALGKSFPCKTD